MEINSVLWADDPFSSIYRCLGGFVFLRVILESNIVCGNSGSAPKKATCYLFRKIIYSKQKVTVRHKKEMYWQQVITVQRHVVTEHKQTVIWQKQKVT